MSEREDNVYKAKLAEQAERYDGKRVFLRGRLSARRTAASTVAPPLPRTRQPLSSLCSGVAKRTTLLDLPPLIQLSEPLFCGAIARIDPRDLRLSSVSLRFVIPT